MKNTKIMIAGDLMPMPCNYELFSDGDTNSMPEAEFMTHFLTAIRRQKRSLNSTFQRTAKAG